MAFPSNNAMTQHTFLTHVGIGDAGSSHTFLSTGTYWPVANVPGVVDVTGMEFAIAMLAEAATTVGQDLASGASTVELTFFDMETAGTSTTDLDADDWINLGVIANATGVARVGAVLAGVNFVYGKPGAIN